MNLNKKKSIIFDMDGVIIDTEPFHFRAHKTAMEAHGFELSEEVYNKKIRSKGRKIGYNAVLGNIDEELFNSISNMKDKLYRELISKEDVFHDDAISLLNYLYKSDLTLAIGTASHDGRYIVKHLDISKYFLVVITGKDVKNNKPNPEIYLKCIDELKRVSEEVIVIEDSEAGVEAALAAGVEVIYVQREDSTISSNLLLDPNVNHVKDLHSILQELTSNRSV